MRELTPRRQWEGAREAPECVLGDLPGDCDVLRALPLRNDDARVDSYQLPFFLG